MYKAELIDRRTWKTRESECEPGAQLEKETCDVLRERAFDVALLGVLGQTEKVEDSGGLERVATRINAYQSAPKIITNQINCFLTGASIVPQ
ncbi:hypothetical protein VL15_08665 [Burkholderia cepacia]|uniref:Uncharacterized protein n=1 Tax=Burkholderia cepacia TaxID=292 RepID=A0A0J5XC87_BURCE|nr:hypothetical protein VL15_08665 [Burkholderia cepacia]